MGRALLTSAALGLLLAACGAPSPEPPAGTGADDGAAVVATATGADPHARVTCAGCHSGGRADGERGAVPRASCATSGCHEDGGPAQVSIATVTFEHRSHGQTGDIAASCAGCHTHDSGREPLRASVDACALCHLEQLTTDDPGDCRLCHQQPRHVTVTAEGVPVAHSQLPWTEVGCVRCHFDVADPPVGVETERCAECHRDVRAATAAGAGSDLHPAHTGVTCTSCHVEGAHHVRAMSSAVSLVCSDCHGAAHGIGLASVTAGMSAAPAAAAEAGADGEARAWTDPAPCAACHQGVHEAQQRLLLGVAPTGRTVPSGKFLAGLTCRSCHVPPAAGPAPEEPIRGQARACAGCHRAEYAQVLDWWLEGLAQRERATRAYVNRALTALQGVQQDSARVLLADADAYLRLVEAAGGQHNLELSDRLFRQSLEHAAAAYRLAGRSAPAAPDLGRPPHMGLCSGCHYDNQPWRLEGMPAGFHREVLRVPEGGD